MKDESYKPEVPAWVADVLTKKKHQDPLATHGVSKQWDDWKRRYSRKYKYAKLNGWEVKEERE